MASEKLCSQIRRASSPHDHNGSQRGNNYPMIMVEIDSNAIIMEPLKSRKYPELMRAYKAMMLQLKRAGIVPKKHILDNEVSEATKEII